MPKVSFRMTSASHESAFRRTDQHGAENSSVRPHRGPVDHRAKRMLRTEGNRCRHTVASSQFLEHWPGGVCRKTGSVMCAGEGTATGTAPCSCSGANRAPPGPTQVLLPGTIGNAPREPPDHTRCIGTTYAGGRGPTDGRPKSP